MGASSAGRHGSYLPAGDSPRPPADSSTSPHAISTGHLRERGLLASWDSTHSRVEARARAELARAAQARDNVDADYDRGPEAWQRVEHLFRQVATRLDAADDLAASEAWLGVAQSVRYQRGRREQFIEAVIGALQRDRANTEASVELADYASAALHVPTFMAIFSRVPMTARPPVLKRMIARPQSRDRLGNMNPEAGNRLRDELLVLARTEADATTVATLIGAAAAGPSRLGASSTA